MPAIIPLILGAGAMALAAIGGAFNQPGPTTKIPDAPDVEGTLRGPGEALVAGQRAAEEGQLAAEEEDQTRALEAGETVQADKEAIVDDIEDTRSQLRGDELAVRSHLADQAEKIKEIPGAVRSEFEQLRAQFDTYAAEAFTQTNKQRSEALGKVMEGQGAALQAAVQGIQGNVNTQVAEIQANPNLTDAQKASMTAQVRLQGASALAPAVGQTVLQFNQLAAETALGFASITGSIQTTVLQQQGTLAGAQGSAFAAAQTAVGQMTNQLLEIEANSTVAFVQAQNQLLATRSMAENTSNDLMLQLLPAQSTPYADFTGSLATQLTFESDIMIRQFEMELGAAGIGIQQELALSQMGTPIGNFAEIVLSAAL